MDLFDLSAKIRLDSEGFKEGLKSAASKGVEFAGKIAAATGAAVVAGATAAVKLASQATEAYATYEQLAGGATLLFGDAYDLIAEKAKNAYSTVQMSQNDYLTQVNSFAVGLKNSLGGGDEAAVKAAELADRIVTAQADVVAATGASQDAVASAFAGIMKGNYTMLDNLQLGITPTKQGMQDIIKLMNKTNGTKYKIGNIADEQSAILDYIEYVEIAGYASKEASSTLEGTLASTKAAWSNLLVAFGSGDGVEDAMSGLIDSGMKYVNNLIPVFQKAFSGIATAIEAVVPVIAQELPGLLETIVPSLIDATTSIISALSNSLGELLPAIGDALMENAPTLLTAGVEMVEMLATSFADLIPQVIEILAGLAPDLASAGLTIMSALIGGIATNLPMLAETAMQIIGTLMEQIGTMLPEFIPAAVDIINQLASAIIDNIGIIVEGAVQLVGGLVEGLTTAIPMLLEKAPEIIKKLVKAINGNMPLLIQSGIDLIMTLMSSIVENLPLLIESAISIIDTLVQGIGENINMFIDGAVQLIMALIQGIAENLPLLMEAAPQIISAIVTSLVQNLPLLVQAGFQLVYGIITGIIENLPEFVKQAAIIVMELVTGLMNKLSQFLEIGGEIITKLIEGIKSFLSDIPGATTEIYNKIKEGIDNIIKKAKTWGKDLVQKLIDGILAKAEALKKAASKIAEFIKNLLGFSEPEEGPLSDFHTYAPDMMNLFIKGIKDNQKKLQQSVAEAFNFRDIIGAGAGEFDGVDVNGSTSGNGNGGLTIVQNISATPQTPVEIAAATSAYFTQARWAI